MNTSSTYEGASTIAGFTVIKAPKLLPGEGNVHTGGIPPWLQTGDSQAQKSSRTVDLKVLLAELKSKRKEERKRKLHPNRLGAEFRELRKRSKVSEDWLPSFGGVWNEGSRGEHQHNFRANVKGAVGVPSRPVTSTNVTNVGAFGGASSPPVTPGTCNQDSQRGHQLHLVDDSVGRVFSEPIPGMSEVMRERIQQKKDFDEDPEYIAFCEQEKSRVVAQLKNEKKKEKRRRGHTNNKRKRKEAK